MGDAGQRGAGNRLLWGIDSGIDSYGTFGLSTIDAPLPAQHTESSLLA
jgi:hypothetical protein